MEGVKLEYMQKALVLWLLACPIWTHAQFSYVVDQSIPVEVDAAVLNMPWAGGLNAAQYNTLDLNGDSQPDLVLFDRMANKPLTFLFDGEDYLYAPEYESFFPELENWLLLRDFNGDGKKDIFTGDVLGIKVYTNTTAEETGLQWERFTFFVQPGSPKSPVLVTEGFTSLINLQIEFDDLPAISDIDGDGDLDILTMRFAGTGTVELHQNMSQELYGSADSLAYKRVTLSWGNFAECDCGVFAFQGQSCPPSAGGRKQHSGGKALLALDVDGDGDIDLLLSEAECETLYLLENTGTNLDPTFTTAVPFPESDPAQFPYYPAPFYEDVDRDGVPDLMVTPNLFNRESLAVNFQHSNWRYMNQGSATQPQFSFVENNFLQQAMIDVGDQAVPALADVDGDGDLDLVIGQSNQAPLAFASLTLFENVGTGSNPRFKWVTDNYLNFLSLERYNLKPYVADLNGDGKVDLLWSSTNQTTTQTDVMVLFNNSAAGFDFASQSPVTLPVNLLFSENISLTDVNGDGSVDLLIGKSNGAIEYWRSQSAGNSLSFTLENATFLGFAPSVERQSLSITTGDLNSDGKADLLVGDQSGKIGIIGDFRNPDASAENLVSDVVFNPLTETYEGRDLGGRVWVTAGNLFGDPNPSLVVGNLLGGLQVLRNDQPASGGEELVAKVYPNPVSRAGSLNIITTRPATVQLISVTGQQITPLTTIEERRLYSLGIPPVSPGLYILRMISDGKNASRKIVILE